MNKAQPKRTFSSVFSSRVFGASKSAGAPKNVNGIVFFETHAVSLDPKNVEKAKHYSKPRLGNVFILSNDKLNRILEILSEDAEEGKFIGTGLKQNANNEGNESNDK